jgi:hypothetical protein
VGRSTFTHYLQPILTDSLALPLLTDFLQLWGIAKVHLNIEQAKTPVIKPGVFYYVIFKGKNNAIQKYHTLASCHHINHYRNYDK